MAGPTFEQTGRLQVAVIGGGVCGLACAVALQKAGVDVHVFEAAAKFGAIGAGIGLGPNSVRALEGMGLLDAILQKLPPGNRTVKGFLFYSGLDDHELIYDYPPAPDLPNVSMQRSVFLDGLVGLTDPQRTSFNKRCASITESTTDPKRLVIHFTDGTSHETDVVLGADGIKSAVRDYVLGERGLDVAACSNTVTYRGMVRLGPLQAAGFKTPLTDRPAAFVGPNKHVVFITIAPLGAVVVAASCTDYSVPLGAKNDPDPSHWVGESSRDDLVKEFEGWGSDVQTLLRHMPEKIPWWSSYVVHPPLETYARGQVALLGDAAHAMMPHVGAGAGQGLEDALLLVRLLSHPKTNRENIESVLKAYSDVRRPRAQSVWDISDLAGRVYEYQGPKGSTPEGLKEDLRDLLNPIWYYDLSRDFASAEEILQKNKAFVQ